MIEGEFYDCNEHVPHHKSKCFEPGDSVEYVGI